MSLRNGTFTAILCCACVCADAQAPQHEGAGSAAPAQTRVLLLRSGRTLAGAVTESSTHFVIDRAVGTIKVPKKDVEFVADDLDAIYRYKLGQIREQDADDHIRLAQWCLVVDLRDRAIDELERATELSPNRARPRALLETVRRSAKSGEKTPAATQSPTAKPASGSPARSYPSFQKELSPAVVSTFSVQIQPLLVRSCATAGCHDSSHSGSLVLRRSPRPSQPITQQNLRAVLAHIDAEDPDRSALLLEPLRIGGAHPGSLFGAGLNEPAYASLTEWVRNASGKPVAKPSAREAAAPPHTTPAEDPESLTTPVVKEDASENLVYSNRPLSSTPARVRAGMVPANSPTESTTTTQIGRTRPGSSSSNDSDPTSTSVRPVPYGDSVKLESNTSSTRADSDTEGRQRAAGATSPSDRYEPIDPFDPEIFNRRFAPQLR